MRSLLHKTKVSRAVKTLENKRFLQRTPLETNRRAEVLSLTKRGQSVLTDLTRLASDYDRKLTRILGDTNHAALTTTLDQLIRHHQAPH